VALVAPHRHCGVNVTTVQATLAQNTHSGAVAGLQMHHFAWGASRYKPEQLLHLEGTISQISHGVHHKPTPQAQHHRQARIQAALHRGIPTAQIEHAFLCATVLCLRLPCRCCTATTTHTWVPANTLLCRHLGSLCGPMNKWLCGSWQRQARNRSLWIYLYGLSLDRCCSFTRSWPCRRQSMQASHTHGVTRVSAEPASCHALQR
jgi:hypothetical protein